jgi:hypothetical protein
MLAAIFAILVEGTGTNRAAVATIDPLAQLGGVSQAMAANDEFVFVGIGVRVQCLVARSDTDPEACGRSDMLPGVIEDVEIVGHRLIVLAAAPDGDLALYGIDVTFESSEWPVSFIANYEQMIEIHAVEKYVLVISHKYVISMGINLEGDWAEIDRVEFEKRPFSAVVVSEKIYIAQGDDGVGVVDIDEFGELSAIAALTDIPAQVIVAKDGMIYTMNNTGVGFPTQLRRVVALRIEDQSRVVELDEIEIPVNIGAMALVGEMLYLLDQGDHGVVAIDVRDPENLVVDSDNRLNVTGSPNAIALSGGEVWLVTDSGLSVLDISDSRVPSIRNHWFFGGVSAGVFQYRDRVFSIDPDAGVGVMRWTGDDLLLDRLDDTVRYGNGVGYSSNEVAAMAYYRGARPTHPVALAGFRLLDLSREEGSLMMSEWPMLDTPNDARIQGDYMYAVDSNALFRVFDIRDTMNPTEVISTTRNELGGRKIALGADRLGVLADGSLLVVYDISEPVSPREVGTWNHPDQESLGTGLRDIGVSGSHFVLTYGPSKEGSDESGRRGMIILEESEKGVLEIVGDLPLARASTFTLLDGFALVSQGDHLAIINLEDATSPQIVAELKLPSCGGRVVAGNVYGDGLLYVSSRDCGVWMYDVSYLGRETSPVFMPILRSADD